MLLISTSVRLRQTTQKVTVGAHLTKSNMAEGSDFSFLDADVEAPRYKVKFQMPSLQNPTIYNNRDQSPVFTAA